MNPEVRDLISSLAKELGVRIIDVERAFKAPFELQAIIMKHRCDRKTQKFPALRIPYFLVFFVPSWNKERLRKLEEHDETV